MPRIKHRQPVDGAGNAGVFFSERERAGNNTVRPLTPRLWRNFEPRQLNPRETKILRIIAAAGGIIVEMRDGKPFVHLADGSGHPSPGYGLSLFITPAAGCKPLFSGSWAQKYAVALHLRAPEDTINRALRRL